MSAMKITYTLFILLLIKSNIVCSQDTYQFNSDIKSTNPAQINLNYVTKVNGTYKTTKLNNQNISVDWSTVSFKIPIDFKDIKLVLLSKFESNQYFIQNLSLSSKNGTSTISNSKFTNMATPSNIRLMYSDSIVMYSTVSSTSTLRLNYTKITPFIYEANGISFQISSLKLKLMSEKKCRLHIYFGTSKIGGYPFSATNHVYQNLSPSDSLVKIQLSLASTFDIDLLRIDFNPAMGQVLIDSLVFESEQINRIWERSNFLDDFIVTSENTRIDINNAIVLIPENQYISIVTDKALSTDKELEFLLLKKYLIALLLLLVVPILYVINNNVCFDINYVGDPY